MSARELRSLRGPQTVATSVPRGRKPAQSNTEATTTKRTQTTTTNIDEEEGSGEVEAVPKPVKKATTKGKSVAKGKKTRYVT